MKIKLLSSLFATTVALNCGIQSAQAFNFVNLSPEFSDRDFVNSKTTPLETFRQEWQEDVVVEIRAGDVSVGDNKDVAENVPETSSTIITTLLFLGLGGVLKIFWTLNYRFCLGCIIHSLTDQ